VRQNISSGQKAPKKIVFLNCLDLAAVLNLRKSASGFSSSLKLPETIFLTQLAIALTKSHRKRHFFVNIISFYSFLNLNVYLNGLFPQIIL
jgi:hypothetical protein